MFKNSSYIQVPKVEEEYNDLMKKSNEVVYNKAVDAIVGPKYNKALYIQMIGIFPILGISLFFDYVIKSSFLGSVAVASSLFIWGTSILFQLGRTYLIERNLKRKINPYKNKE